MHCHATTPFSPSRLCARTATVRARRSRAAQADELITSRLREALALVDIRVLDHFVVGGSKFMSFAERGLI